MLSVCLCVLCVCVGVCCKFKRCPALEDWIALHFAAPSYGQGTFKGNYFLLFFFYFLSNGNSYVIPSMFLRRKNNTISLLEAHLQSLFRELVFLGFSDGKQIANTKLILPCENNKRAIAAMR